MIAFVAALGIASAGCSSKSSPTKTAAAGAPKAATAKLPSSSTATPSTKGGSNLTDNTSSAVADDRMTCSSAEEGLAVCVDDYALFCEGGKAWALDCSVAFDGATCGSLDDGTIDCVVTQ
jgi:hypothetical protein